MKQIRIRFTGNMVAGLAILLFLALTISSCEKEKDKDKTPNENKPVRQYDAAAAIGDIVSIVVNDNDMTISYKNHTIGDSGLVSFTRIASGLMKGALEIEINGNPYYLLEIPGQMIITYLPFSGKDEFVAGVIHHDYTPGDHLGAWLFFNYEPNPNDDNYWGRANITTNGRFDLELWNFSGQTFHTESGSWQMNASNPSIIYSVPDGTNDTIEETIYVLPDKLRIYDSGPQVGIGIGFAEPDQAVTLQEITGTYATIWSGGCGSFTINDDETMTASFYVNGQLFSDIQYNDLRRTTPADPVHFNNTFYFTDHIMPGPNQEVYLFILPGDAMLAVYHDDHKGMLSSLSVRVDR